jgi:hypothetical protein
MSLQELKHIHVVRQEFKMFSEMGNSSHYNPYILMPVPEGVQLDLFENYVQLWLHQCSTAQVL